MARSVQGRGPKGGPVPKVKVGKNFSKSAQKAIPFHCPCNGSMRMQPVKNGKG